MTQTRSQRLVAPFTSLHPGCATTAVVILLLVTGCGDGAGHEPPADTSVIPGPNVTYSFPTPESETEWRSEGAAWMAGELERLYREAWDSPAPYFHMNLRRARVIHEMMESGALDDEPAVRLRYARELLDGGATEHAIEEIERIVAEQGADPENITRSTRPLFELLAFAYQRLGEQRNCLESHSPEVCIMPFRGGGIHLYREGSQRAIEIFADVLRHNPGDFQSRWLYNVAHMTLGLYPDEVPEPWRIDGIVSRHDYPEFENAAVAAGADVFGLSGSVSIDDFDNDGFLDIFTTGYGLKEPARFLLNDGQGGFDDVTVAAGLRGQVSGLNVIHADYDNDGYVDVFVLRGAWLGDRGMHPNSLLRNNGDGTFSDVTIDAGVLSYHPTNSAVWVDVNLDGWLDLFIGNESRFSWEQDDPFYGGGGEIPHPCELYLNRGDGTFEEVASEVGLDVVAFVKGVTAGDVDNDGRPDLYVSIMGARNLLFLNRGGDTARGLRFEEYSGPAGVSEPVMSFPVWFWDIDNDGWEDLMVFAYGLYQSTDATSDVAREYLGRPTMTAKSIVYRNRGNGTFEDVSRQMGLDRSVIFAMGANFGDVNNDGYPDFYLGTGAPQLLSLIPNRMYVNERENGFREVTLSAAVGHLQKGHGVGFGDFDRDGSQDIYESMGGAVQGDESSNVLFRNPVPEPENAWATLLLEGRRANRSAIGARIRAVVGEQNGSRHTVFSTATTGGSFGSSSLQVEMGLGPGVRIDTLQITWPNRERSVDTFTDLPVRQHLRIVEGETPEVLDRPPVPFRTERRSPHAHH